MIIDIRELNQISQPDFYSLFLQTDIILTVRECQYIFTINCAFFFYQWLVNLNDQHKFTVISHQEQKHFNVMIMKYYNSSSYVQRQMNWILCAFCAFAWSYIDDIVIFFKTLDEHISHLHQVFQLFQNLNISLKSKKFFLNYFTVTLLRQRVNVLELFISEKKIKTLTDSQFSTTLKILEIYLELTGWLHFYIFYYAQITTSLQTQKTVLSKTLLMTKENTWKQQVSCIFIDKSSSEELCAFETL